MGPALRRLLLTAHIVCSVGWLGAVAGSAVLAAASVLSDDAQVVRAVHPALEVVGWYALVPLSVASLLSGLVQGWTSKWGVLRHYWVVTKLVINVVASVVLVLYMQTLGALADSATGDLDALRSPSPLLHSAAALALLVAATALSVFKPAGWTRYGWRREAPRAREHRSRARGAGA